MVAATEMEGAEAAEEAAALWVVMAACKEVREVRAAMAEATRVGAKEVVATVVEAMAAAVLGKP